MKKLLDKVYIPIIIFLLVQLYVSNELFWFMGFSVFCYAIVKEKFKIFIPFKEYKILYVFMIWGILFGAFLIGIENIGFRDYLRDIFYYSTPIIYIYIGAYYARKKITISRVLNSFIISSAAISFIYIIRIIRQGAVFLSSSDIHGWRSLSGGGAIVIGVSLAIQLSDLIKVDEKLPKVLNISCLAISGLFFTISLSRTNLLIIIIITIVLSLKRQNSKKAIKRFFAIIFAVLMVIFLSTILLPAGFVKEYISKIFNSLIEVSTSNVWNAATIQNNWRGYENYCAIEQWKDSSIFVQFFGSGFGKRIYVGDFAYRYLGQLNSDGSPADSIAVLHNGYATQLIKQGLLGVAIYIGFYISVINSGWKLSVKTRSIEARLLLAVGITLMFQTYFLNGLFRDYCYYPVILLLGYTAYKSRYLKEECIDLS